MAGQPPLCQDTALVIVTLADDQEMIAPIDCPVGVEVGKLCLKLTQICRSLVIVCADRERRPASKKANAAAPGLKLSNPRRFMLGDYVRRRCRRARKGVNWLQCQRGARSIGQGLSLISARLKSCSTTAAA